MTKKKVVQPETLEDALKVIDELRRKLSNAQSHSKGLQTQINNLKVELEKKGGMTIRAH